MQFSTLLLPLVLFMLPMFVSAAPIPRAHRRSTQPADVQCAPATNVALKVHTHGGATVKHTGVATDAPTGVATDVPSTGTDVPPPSTDVPTGVSATGLPVSTGAYKVADFYQGQSFLDEWNFYDKPDPTHGSVNYLAKADAVSKGLAKVTGSGDNAKVILSVDSTSKLPVGTNRDSVRISSAKTYNGGLFIADFEKMPYGPTVWPAWWSVGVTDWPNTGEIDVIEGANSQTTNQYALHTKAGCSLDPGTSKLFQATPGNLKCASSNGDNTGCQIRETDERSYGAGFNAGKGGVYAHLWDHTGISIWHFARADIPDDITSKSPNPAKWGKPSAFYSAATCDPSKFFHDHTLVINTTLCGDWAGSAFPGGKDACLAAVADPKTYDNPSWEVNYVAVYNKP